MPTLTDIAWLIPAMPFLGASLLGVLFFSFTKTMSRLSKPTGVILFTCMAISTAISYLLVSKELANEIVKESSLTIIKGIGSLNLNIGILVDKVGAIILSISCTIVIISMTLFHLNRYRKKGYVFLFTSFVLLSSIILMLPLSSMARLQIDKLIS